MYLQLRDAVEFFSELPGSLVYYLVVLFAFQFAAAIAVTEWRRERTPVHARLALVTAALALLALATPICELLWLSGTIDGLIVVPPLARAVSTLSLLGIIWAFAFPTPHRWADLFFLIIALLILAGAGASWAWWAQDVFAGTQTFFNGSPQETAWIYAQLALMGLGLILIFARRQLDWFIGTGLLLVLIVAQLGYLFSPVYEVEALSRPGAVWLAEIIALPLFTAMVYRRAATYRKSAIPASSGTAAPVAEPATPPPSPRRLEPRAAAALASLTSATSPDELAQLVTLAVAHAARADLCLLIAPPDELGMCQIQSAYDLARGQFASRSLVATADLPELRTAITKTDLTRLRPGQHLPDLRRLTNAVGHGQAGPALIAPLHFNQQPVGALAVIRLTSRQEWSPDDEALLTALTTPIAEALSSEGKLNRLLRTLDKSLTQAANAEEARRAARLEADQLHIALENARSEAERLNADIQQLRQAMEQARSADEIAALTAAAVAERTASFTELESELREKFQTAEEELSFYRAQAEQLQKEIEPLREKLEDAQRRRQELQNELEPLRASVLAFGTQSGELERLRIDLQVAREQQMQREAEVERLRAELDETRRQIIPQDQLNAVQRFTAESQERLASTQHELEAYIEREAELRAEIERLRAEAETAQARVEAELQTLRELAEKQEAQLLDYQFVLQQEQTLRQELEAAQNENRRLKAEYSATRAEASAETQALLIKTQAELSDARERLAIREQELAATQASLTTMLEQVSEFTNARAELDQLRNRLTVVQNELVDREAEIETLRVQWAEAKEQATAKASQLADLQARVTLLSEQTNQLGHMQTELAEARLQLAKFTIRTDRLTNVQMELETLRAELAQAQTALSESQQQLAAKQSELIATQSQLSAASEQSKQLALMRAQMETLRGQLGKAQTGLAEAQRELSAKEVELAEATAALSELASQTQTLTLTQKQLEEKERLLAQTQALHANLPDASGRPFLPEASVEVIASLAQELRQPMSAIVGYSELLLGESVGILGALQRKFLERIKASCERMNTLLGDLINVTDIDSGSLHLMPESVDIMTIVEDAILSCGAQFREKSINLRLDVAEDLPAVSADRDALRQIITHLLSNAGNASGVEGEVVLRVRQETSPLQDGQDSALLIAVRDSGGGIAPADQPRVFARFYRADAPLIAGLGETGVGLSIAKALVEAHGGRIWFTSEPGRGSTFTVLLPVQHHNGQSPSTSL